MSQVQIRGRGIESGFDAKGSASFIGLFEALTEVAFANDFYSPLGYIGELFGHRTKR